jgi:hypothetical protein
LLMMLLMIVMMMLMTAILFLLHRLLQVVHMHMMQLLLLALTVLLWLLLLLLECMRLGEFLILPLRNVSLVVVLHVLQGGGGMQCRRGAVRLVVRGRAGGRRVALAVAGTPLAVGSTRGG